MEYHWTKAAALFVVGFTVLSTCSGQKTGVFNNYVDHFNLMSYGAKTYPQKFLYEDKYWKNGSGPIFFYAGNEGPIEAFWEASGFIHEMAPEFGALELFPEHRFYGKSLPFGDKSFESPYLGLLTIEQAMADYAVFLDFAKKKFGAENSKIIAFGGSYGGMLAAYMRFKYPNLIDGALAASAPIFMQAQKGPHDFFFAHVTKDFRDVDEKCYSNIRAAFQQMDTLASQGQTGLDEISSQFKLCNKLNSTEAYRHLLGWVRNAFTFMAMLDYPYPTKFMGDLPAFPVKVGCSKMLSGGSLLQGLADAAGVYYNASKVQCYNIFTEFIECADPTGCGLGPDAVAWNYQACTEITLPSGSNNVTDMFPVLPWTPELRKDYCQKQFGISVREEWSEIQFFGMKIASATNIIFSNGNLDPWMGGGVTKDLSPSLIAVPVVGGAHHLDLRASNKADPPGVIEAREIERKTIRKWLMG